MSIPYAAGVAAAIAAGFTFNLGMVIQKAAVSQTRRDLPLARQLIRSPLWVTGFLAQFLIGTPLNLLAALRVGPAVLPGLLATGLIVLAVGAVVIAREQLSLEDIAGIVLVGGGIALFGLSRLAVDMAKFPVWEPAFLVRLVVFSAAVLAVAGVGHLAVARLPRQHGMLRALDAGLFYALSNLWIVVSAGMLETLAAGDPLASLPLAIVATLAAAGASAYGVLQLQRAFQSGAASRVVPISQVPQQALPLIIYLAVFRLAPPNRAALPLAGAGVLAILIGAVFLARRQARGA